MRLKQLTMQGYKTFASKTEFVFDQGITAIVGPNGSGKSNVADALRWVLGEQSYRSLRGKRTVDMIFAGSKSRPRAGMAQAILTLDNSDGWLPIDYSEVEISRRAYRTGENEYAINGTRVRLRDVQELLATSGLAERTYTIIGQGLVDRALSLRAEERRALFEEAAGISHYKSRRAETLRRLEETRRNLERVNDILSEITPRMNSLRRQARRARNYEQIQQDLRHLLRIWYGYQWEQAKNELRRRRQAAQGAEAVWQENRDQLKERQGDVDALRRKIAQSQRQSAELQAKREQVREQQENTKRRVAVLTERRSLLERQLADIEQEMPQLTEGKATAQRALDKALAELTTAQNNLSEQETQLFEFQASFEAQQARIDTQQNEVRRLERDFGVSRTKLAQAEGQLSQLIERQQEAIPDVAEELADLTTHVGALAEAATSAQGKVDELRQQREKVRKQQQSAVRKLKQMRRQQADLNRQVNGLQKETAKLEARVDLLNQRRQKALTVRGALGQLASLVTIPAEHQPALEAALGARLEMLVLPNAEALWQLADKQKGKRAFVAAVLGDVAGVDGGLPGRAHTLITYDKKYSTLVELLFGNIVIVDSRKEAYKVGVGLPAGAMAVTADGFIVHGGGIVEQTTRDSRQSVLAREAAWREAQEELEQQGAKVSQAQTEADDHQTAINEKQSAVDKLNNEERRLGRLINEANQRLARAQRDHDRIRQQVTFLEKQKANAAQNAERLVERIEQTKTTIATQQETVVRLEQEVGQARVVLAGLPINEAKQQRQTWRQQVETARTIVSGREAVVESHRTTHNQIAGQLNRLQARQKDLQTQQDQLKLDEAQANLKVLEEKRQAIDAQLRPLTQALTKQQDQLGQAEEALSTLQRQTHDQETLYTQTKVALSQHHSIMEGLQDRIKTDLGLVALRFADEQVGQTPLPMSEVVEQLPEVNELPSDIEDTIQRYRGQLQRLGPVNPDAPEEYEQTQTRHAFLTQQVDDLRTTEHQLREVISELDVLTSEAFAKTVEEVNGIFGAMFTQLFGGGSAHLVLTEPNDLTVSGVDIIAQLPNRREQGLGLLSGGERSLTAAALIFALLRVSPPPFCVMDEVDAMLDEANVTRFREALQALSEGSQFIVITHNRGTVQAAQTVYGISMNTDSTSQVISIKPDEYVNQPLL